MLAQSPPRGSGAREDSGICSNPASCCSRKRDASPVMVMTTRWCSRRFKIAVAMMGWPNPSSPLATALIGGEHDGPPCIPRRARGWKHRWAPCWSMGIYPISSMLSSVGSVYGCRRSSSRFSAAALVSVAMRVVAR